MKKGEEDGTIEILRYGQNYYYLLREGTNDDVATLCLRTDHALITQTYVK